MNNFETLLDTLDLKLFQKVESLLTKNDKRSLLACQKGVRELLPEYTYLEIGSYMGGSLQPHVQDDHCRRIYSVDKRPPVAPDVSGFDRNYKNNSTENMLHNLRELSEEGTKKIITLDGDVNDIDPARVEEKPQLCFVDGEHTDEAAMRDFMFCYKVMAENGAVMFHDSAIIYNSLWDIIKFVESEGRTFRAYNIADYVFVLELGDFPLHRSEAIKDMLMNNYVGYLNSMQYTEPYRKFTMKPIFRFVRAIKYKFIKPKYV
jgi:Methyltransferase domain